MAERNRLHPALRAPIYVVLLVLVATGVLWELDVERALLMKIHGAAAMASLILLGGLLARHVPAGWTARANRTSGAALLAASLWLITSGYALYYSGSDVLRSFASQTHFWVGVAFVVTFGLHQRPTG